MDAQLEQAEIGLNEVVVTLIFRKLEIPPLRFDLNQQKLPRHPSEIMI